MPNAEAARARKSGKTIEVQRQSRFGLVGSQAELDMTIETQSDPHLQRVLNASRTGDLNAISRYSPQIMVVYKIVEATKATKHAQ